MRHATFRPYATLCAIALCAAPLTLQPAFADDDTPKDAPRGPAVTVLEATKSCFSDIVEAVGTIMAREETAVRPERPGSKVTNVMVEPGDTVASGQVLAELARPEGGTQQITAPIDGMIATSSAQIGGLASLRGETLFSIIAHGEYDLVAMVSASDVTKLSVGQRATLHIVGSNDLDGKVRRIAPTVEQNIQQSVVYISISTSNRLLLNSSGRAMIKTGQSCNVAVPLTAVQYSPRGTMVQIVRRNRVETQRVETGLSSGGEIEIREGLNEGDTVIARAGALLREGDPVRPVKAATESQTRPSESRSLPAR
ncbi:MAG: efflux RND transporter periplasmic adaptor subunit [Alphaproteobacteria bacterium]|nr:efflux RND transporter periplasmic adaptor subunit [Alphaproteobacteria bacterium]